MRGTSIPHAGPDPHGRALATAMNGHAHFERLADEWGRPVWLWPAPSLRLLARPYADQHLVVVKYGPGLASRFAVTPGRPLWLSCPYRLEQGIPRCGLGASRPAPLRCFPLGLRSGRHRAASAARPASISPRSAPYVISIAVVPFMAARYAPYRQICTKLRKESPASPLASLAESGSADRARGPRRVPASG